MSDRVDSIPGGPDVQGSDLVRRAQAGDRAAFRRLYEDHVGRVYALCLRLTGEPEEAMERTQDVFVRAWKKLGSFRGEAAFSTWLHRLAVNVILGRRETLGIRRQRHLEELSGRLMKKRRRIAFCQH